MNTTLLFHLITLAALTPVVIYGQGAGPLLPPGPPADGVYRTLDEVYERADAAAANASAASDARIPISSVPFSIDSRGSYYLTADLVVNTGIAILISTDHVQLDLNGFTISSTANPSLGAGIRLTSNRSHITIRNGFIRSTGTVTAGSFSGAGFQSGIDFTGTAPRNATVENVFVSGCSQDGVALSVTTDNNTIVRMCSLEHIGETAIRAELVSQCVVSNVGRDGIIATNAHLCRVTDAWELGIFAESATQCTALSTNDIGISGGTVADCVARSINSDGLSALTAQNSIGFSDTGVGLRAGVASNCRALTETGPASMIVSGTATTCRGEHRGGGTAIDAAIAVSCTSINGPILSPQKHLGTP